MEKERLGKETGRKDRWRRKEEEKMEQEGRFDFEKFQPHHFSGGLVT